MENDYLSIKAENVQVNFDAIEGNAHEETFNDFPYFSNIGVDHIQGLAIIKLINYKKNDMKRLLLLLLLLSYTLIGYATNIYYEKTAIQDRTGVVQVYKNIISGYHTIININDIILKDNYWNKNDITMEDYTFFYWKHKEIIFYPGESYHYDGSSFAFFTAQWGYIVSYETNGGTEIKKDSLLVTIGASKNLDIMPTVQEPTSTRENYIVEGWYLDDQFNTRYTFGEPLTENITLYAKWVPSTYNVTLTPTTGVKYDKSSGDKVTHSNSYTFEIELEDGYKQSKPVVKVKRGNNEAETLSPISGKYTISNITTDITVTVEEVILNKYDIILTPANGVKYNKSSGEKVTHNNNYTFEIELEDGYDEQSKPVVMVQRGNNDPEPLDPDDPDTYSYTISNIKENITVSVEGVVANPPGIYHTVNLILAPGITVNHTAGELTIEDGDHLFLQFHPEDPTLTAEDILFRVDGVETAFTRSTDGCGGSFILNPIEKDYSIEISLREKIVDPDPNPDTTSNATLTHGVHVAVENGELKIENETTGTVHLAIYTLTGKLYISRSLPEGTTLLSPPAGIYIVRAGEVRWKIMIND